MQSRFHPEPSDDSRAEQRQSRRAALAVAVAPMLVLVALTLVIGDVIGADVGLTGVSLAVAWLVFEMHLYQRSIARADDEFAATVPTALLK